MKTFPKFNRQDYLTRIIIQCTTVNCSCHSHNGRTKWYYIATTIVTIPTTVINTLIDWNVWWRYSYYIVKSGRRVLLILLSLQHLELHNPPYFSRVQGVKITPGLSKCSWLASYSYSTSPHLDFILVWPSLPRSTFFISTIDRVKLGYTIWSVIRLPYWIIVLMILKWCE